MHYSVTHTTKIMWWCSRIIKYFHHFISLCTLCSFSLCYFLFFSHSFSKKNSFQLSIYFCNVFFYMYLQIIRFSFIIVLIDETIKNLAQKMLACTFFLSLPLHNNLEFSWKHKYCIIKSIFYHIVMSKLRKPWDGMS